MFESLAGTVLNKHHSFCERALTINAQLITSFPDCVRALIGANLLWVSGRIGTYRGKTLVK